MDWCIPIKKIGTSDDLDYDFRSLSKSLEHHGYMGQMDHFYGYQSTGKSEATRGNKVAVF